MSNPLSDEKKEVLAKLAERFSNWEFSLFTHFTGRENATVQDVADTVAHSALQGDSCELWGISLPQKASEDAAKVVCYTGNGPNSRAHAEFLVNSPAAISSLIHENAELKRELYGTPDKVIWSKQQWIDNAQHWKESWDLAIHHRDMAVLGLTAAEAERDKLREALRLACEQLFDVKNSLMEMRESKDLTPMRENWVEQKIADFQIEAALKNGEEEI